MKTYRVNIILRILLLAIFIFLSSWFFLKEFYLFSASSTLLIIYQLYLLFRYTDKINKELTYLLQSINYSDFSHNFNFSSRGNSFGELSNEFNKIMDKFRQARMEREESIKYLETVVQHIGVGLISFNQKGDVGFVNRAAKRLLNLQALKNIGSLNKISPGFSEFIFNIPTGKKATYKIVEAEGIIQLLLYATDFRMKEQVFKLVALQNIQPELEEKEIEAWQKLIRVLTHEIMNSVTPISSLASTVNLMLKNEGDTPALYDSETVKDIKTAVNTIEKRSIGLINFVDKYRSLTKIPKPDFRIIRIEQLFERIRILTNQLLNENGINLTTAINPPYLEMTIDSDLIEQVLINLIKNAVQSISSSEGKTGYITLAANIDHRGRGIIKVTDDGPGIPENIIERIFIPFFSTKKDGSGIGLSLSSQIMRSHSGSLSVSSVPGKETVFTLRF